MGQMSKFPRHKETDLHSIANNFYLRCDAKQFNDEYQALMKLDDDEFVYLGDLLPNPLIRGSQPKYVTDGVVSVINTLSIQKLQINVNDCRKITQDAFNMLEEARVLKKGDVLLTLDGGTSIGKSALFELDGDYTVDSHVAIIRNPVKISPKSLVYLLASPLCQMQFKKMESGASGQTSVTEDDLRRLIIPIQVLNNIESKTLMVDQRLLQIRDKRQALDIEEAEAWKELDF